MAEPYKIQITPLRDVPGYEDFINGIHHRLLYHSRPWIRIMESIIGDTCQVISAHHRKRLCGALPVFISRDRGAGRVINSLPFFGSIGGILCQPGQIDKVGPGLFNALDGLAHDLGAATAMVNPGPFDPDVSLHKKLWRPDFEEKRMAQVLKLPESKSELLSLFHPAKRQNIRSAIAKGSTVRPFRMDDLDWFVDVHNRGMAAKNGIAKPRAFFHGIIDKLFPKGPFRIDVAEFQGIPFAGLLYALWGHTAEYLVPVYEPDRANLFGLPLLIHHAMARAVAHGIRRWNFGGTWNSQRGLYRFKASFGAQEKGYPYFIKVYDKRILSLDKGELMRYFPWYYSLPFDLLDKAG
ncbi:MAG: peptidoglycan bridge formation glycyltransferase FemA/FemB family protein [Desulfobacter sp.]|nr:MAG: peptidoglycan bridge formation glycyltransferase FemA/FemB family protein [Desulfobacter sp.]